MNGMEMLVQEHDHILRLNRVARAACLQILEGKAVPVADFRSMISFIREYADKHHHGKEEQILFKEMIVQFGKIGENLVTHGMLVEHDLARLHIAELEAALDACEKECSADVKLDIIANAIQYTKLLQRHIDKENNVVYTYAEKHFTTDVLAQANAKMETAEKQAEESGVQRKYLELLHDLEKKYIG